MNQDEIRLKWIFSEVDINHSAVLTDNGYRYVDMLLEWDDIQQWRRAVDKLMGVDDDLAGQ